MDQVLSLQRQLSSLCQPNLLDGALGWPGLTEALVELKLLTGPKTEDGRLLGVEPNSFAVLMSRVQCATVPSTGAAREVVPLSEGRRYGMAADAMAWAVAQVVGGSLAAFDWPQPFHLCDLQVDGRRFRALLMSQEVV